MCRSTAGSGRRGRRRPRRLALFGALLAVAALLLGGCRTARTVFDTTRALQNANFDGVTVGINRVQGTDAVRVKVRASSGPAINLEGSPELQAAHIVWDTFRFRFDAVDVKIGGGVNRIFSYGQLEQRFGPRPASYDARSVRSDVVTGARWAAVVGGIVALVVIAGVVVTIVLIVRHRRRRPPPQQWYGPGPPPGQPAWPQPAAGGWPPPGQQGWPPPGQQGWPPPGQQQWPPPGEPGQPPSGWPPPGDQPPSPPA